MTLREIIYDIYEHLNIYTEDSDLSEEHLAFLVNTKRAMLVRQYISNLKKVMPKEAMQVLCLNLEIDDDCLEDKKVLRSINKIPSTIDSTGRSNLANVYTSNFRFTKNLNIIDYYKLPFVDSIPYNTKQLYVAVDPESYLIVYNPSNLHLNMEQIEVEGLFEDPEAAYEMSCDSDTQCDFLDADYPVELSMVDQIRNLILQDLMVKYNIPKDEINDGEKAQAQDQS